MYVAPPMYAAPTSNAHVFYAGSGAATSNELKRVTGAGNMVVTGAIASSGIVGTTTNNNATALTVGEFVT